jgi:hypothetical protein
MFNFFKPCKHKNSVHTNIDLVEGLHIANTNIVGSICKEVHYCQDCRVVFVPMEKEKMMEFHEKRAGE